MAKDVYNLAQQAFGAGRQFHLVGHDHGAGLGWLAAAQSGSRLLSYAALAVPHTSALGAALYGPEADPVLQRSMNYVRQARGPPAAFRLGRRRAFFAAFLSATGTSVLLLPLCFW